MVDDVKNPTRTLLDDPKTIEGLQFYADMSNLYGAMPTPVAFMNFGMGADRMFAERPDRDVSFPVFGRHLFRNYNISWDVVMFPKNAEGKRRLGQADRLLHPEIIQNKKEAWEVIKALTGPKGQELFREAWPRATGQKGSGRRFSLGQRPQPPANKKMLNDAVQQRIQSLSSPVARLKNFEAKAQKQFLTEKNARSRLLKK